MIHFFSEDIDLPDFDKEKTIRWINLAASEYGKKAGNIHYIFCSDKKILEVNKEYLNHDYYTDIITFDYSTGNKISGDIYVGLQTVESNSKEQKTDFEEELKRVIIHGILHLCGQKDKTPADELEMREKENTALALFSTI